MLTSIIISAFINTPLSYSSSKFNKFFPGAVAFGFYTNLLKLFFFKCCFPKPFSNNYIGLGAKSTNSGCCNLCIYWIGVYLPKPHTCYVRSFVSWSVSSICCSSTGIPSRRYFQVKMGAELLTELGCENFPTAFQN